MSILHIMPIVIAFFYINSCSTKTHTHNTPIDEFKGKEIILPSDSSTIKIISTNTYSYSSFFEQNNVKLVVSLNGECGTCISKLNAVEAFFEEIYLYYDISLLVYVNSKTTDFHNFEILNNSEINFKYPLLYDYENSFLKENKFLSNEFNHILLCDKNNKILMIGDFASNKNLREQYVKEIQKHADPLIYDYPIIRPVYKSPLKSP